MAVCVLPGGKNRFAVLGWQLMEKLSSAAGWRLRRAFQPVPAGREGERVQGFVAKEQPVLLVSATGENPVPGRDDSLCSLSLLLQNCNG